MIDRPATSLGSMAPGINNRVAATRLGTVINRQPATFLYAADNTDIKADGFVRRRRGVALASAGRVHSAWGDAGDDGYAVVDGALTHLQAAGDALTLTPLLSGFTDAPLSFARMPTGDVYWSDGQQLGRLTGAAPRAVLPPAPNPVPAVAVTAGALPAGRYLLAFTLLTADGEGPATQPVQFDVPDGSGFSLTGLSPDTLVYMSGPNGDVLTHIATVGVIASLSNTGTRCQTLQRALMPAGQIVRHFKGRLLVARGSVLYLSDPYYYGLYDPAAGYVPLPADITVVEPCEGGAFICADKTYWLTPDLTLTTVLPFGGLLGTGGFSEQAQQAWWVSPRGLVIGTPDGQALAVQDSALTFGAADRGAAMFREDDGGARIVFTRQGVKPNTTAARDFIESEAKRKEAFS